MERLGRSAPPSPVVSEPGPPRAFLRDWAWELLVVGTHGRGAGLGGGTEHPTSQLGPLS